MEELDELLRSNPDPRELRRALAVQMVYQRYTYYQIRDVLKVSVGFISKWKRTFELKGVKGLTLQHKGSSGYLGKMEREKVVDWLKGKNYWNLQELQHHIEEVHGVVFASPQSYYQLFSEAPNQLEKDPKKKSQSRTRSGRKKQEIQEWLEKHRLDIIFGKLLVFFQDECHLLWGDLCGYVWGKTSERIEVPMTNQPQKQTYYGALNLQTQEFIVQAYEKGNSASTIAFLQVLLDENPQSRIAMIWDGASYHRSQAVKDYLASVNQGLQKSDWKITCIRFAPNDPKQNPVEDVWLQGKRFIREFYHLCQSFSCAKYLFELVTHRQTFDFSKIFMYGNFS